MLFWISHLTDTVPRYAIVLLVVMTLVWGTNWPIFPFALEEISVWTFRSVALPVTGLVLLWVGRLQGHSISVDRQHWPTMIGVALAYMVVWNIATPVSTTLIASGQSAVLGFTMPLWVAILSWPFLGEKFTPRLLLAMLLGITSVILIMVPSFELYAQAPLGVALGLAAGFGWAVGTIIQKRRPVPVPPAILVGWILLITTIPIWIATVFLAQGPWFMPSWQTIGAVAYISLVPMVFGNLCWFSIVGLLPANLAALSTIMVPIVAMVSGAIVHREPLGMIQIAAMGCSALALSLVLLKRSPNKE